ncbi:MAG: DNA primase family protein [Planctomycetota bacterium]|jgi:putative DNA primase/helicase
MESTELAIKDNKIEHDVMARYLMSEYYLKTLVDTEETLVFNWKRGYYTHNGAMVIKRAVHKLLTKQGLASKSKKGYINEVTAFIQRSTYVNRTKFNSKQHLLNIGNGILNIRKGKLVPHNPKLLSTIRIPVDYDEEAECPTINRFFGQIVAEEDVRILVELFAWCLDINSTIQRFVILVGEGANGKSTFIRLLRAFIGEDNCTSITLQSLSSNRFASSELYGKLVNLYPDLPTALVKDTGPLKALTGGDAIPAERKFERGFTFVNKAKLIFSANKPPVIDDEGYAIWRRAVIIEFPNKFEGENRDPDLLDKLTVPEELSGLLNLAVEKLRILRERGDFSYNPSWKRTRKKYTVMSDPVADFVEKECELDPLEEILTCPQ